MINYLRIVHEGLNHFTHDRSFQHGKQLEGNYRYFCAVLDFFRNNPQKQTVTHCVFSFDIIGWGRLP